jgi:predicted anti-sigma-YlaC factor YlaD
MKNKDCHIVEHNLFDYLENRLSGESRRDVEAHLSGCESCRELVDSIESVENIIRKARSAETDPFVATRIIQHIENTLEPVKHKHSGAIRPVLLALTLACAVATGFFIGKINSERLQGYAENQSQVENLKTELFIHDFIDEDKTLQVNK